MTNDSHPKRNDDPGDLLDRCELFLNIINRFVGLFARESNRMTTNDTTREYPFVAMDPRQVYQQLVVAAAALKVAPFGPTARFLDVGCGIGNVMLFAEQLGFTVFGLEKDPYSSSIAIKLFGEERIFRHDIWGFEDFGEFDAVYYFRPFAEGDLEERFEALVEERLKPSGVLIANHKISLAIEEDRRFIRLDENLPVWRKRG